MKIQIVLEGQTLAATLEDTPAARAFADMLPLALDLADYHGIEKIADLPAALPTDDAPAGIDPEVGDITLYAPWGNLAIFYRDFGYARGLVRLGRIDGSTAALEAKGPLPARIERMDAAQ
ncbi:cyclophilin-like fold protein [Halomonas beimenensis]|nr:cyclophilin-like fold protein [Halomonas beimenensis]